MPRWTCRASASRSTTGRLRCWKQTWVDSQGGYLDFAGGFENGAMELRRNGEVDGTPDLRMRWENIEANSFDWRWQRSVDGGETWTSLWELEYRRVLLTSPRASAHRADSPLSATGHPTSRLRPS